ncbi:MAG: type I methionyl aminopeptidase [Elusimicrobia bacterium GWA2_69_24]|nr:MAG: type I methionyl aminopeptidase [Elusimicrobia bacterium GWA2_69_24]
MTVDLKTREDIQKMREAGALLAGAVERLRARVRPGVCTAELDASVEADLRSQGAKPAFLGYRGYPATLCVSINDEVVHGIPTQQRLLRDGDVVSFDLGCKWRGFFADMAVTVAVGEVSPEARRLIATTRTALEKGIAAVRPGARIGDVGWAVQECAEAAGFSVVRDFVGHGIGRALHEDPAIPNYGKPGTGVRLQPGMVLAIEPMVNCGGPEVRVLEDRWTAVTGDGRLSAHFEHTVAVTEDGPSVLTRLEEGLGQGR